MLVVLAVPADPATPAYLDAVTEASRFQEFPGGPGTPDLLNGGGVMLTSVSVGNGSSNARAAFLALRFGSQSQVADIAGPAMFVSIEKDGSLASVPNEVVSLAEATFGPVKATPAFGTTPRICSPRNTKAVRRANEEEPGRT